MSIRKTVRGADVDTRRTFLSGMARSMFGVGAGAMFGPSLIAGALNQDPKRTKAQGSAPIVLGNASAKHVIYLFMSGGMSHIDTLDPKPGQKTHGPKEAVATNVDGIQLGGYLHRGFDDIDWLPVE